MNASHSSRGQTLPAVAVALGAIALVGVAFAILVSRPAPSNTGSVARPSATPAVSAPAPSATAYPSPSTRPSASPEPSKAPGRITLDSATGQDVVAAVGDQTGTLRGVVSGHPGDGMSVRWHDSIVEQAGPDSIRITWVGLPRDERVDIGVNDVDGPLTVVIVQAGPAPYSDAMGEDRIVVLTFDHHVDAADVAVEILDRTVD